MNPGTHLPDEPKNSDHQLTRAEFTALAESWFTKLSAGETGPLHQEQFTAKLGDLLPAPDDFGPPGGPPPGDAPPARNGRGGFSPATFLGPGLFTALDASKDGSLTRAEFKETFAQWFDKWAAGKDGTLGEDKLREGLAAVLPAPEFPGGGGGRGRGRGNRGPGGGVKVNGVELDPLVAANDPDKPLLSKLLAVPALRTRYLGYVRDIAQRWLDWKKLGPIAQQYQALIAEEVKADTRKLDTTEAFFKGISEDLSTEAANAGAGGGHSSISLKSFADQRRAYLLKVTAAGK